MATKDEIISAQWQQIAIELGDKIYRTVNTPEYVGTDDETGYLLMFFNQKNHKGQSTIISTADRAATKKLLKKAMREIDGPKTTTVYPPKYPN